MRMITLDLLDDDSGIRHAFLHASGWGQRGALSFLELRRRLGRHRRKRCAKSRDRHAARLGLAGDRLVTCRQIHSATAIAVEKPWRARRAPKADGMVTRVAGIALGMLTADCAPILFHDPTAGVIGAAHGGWRGALGGIVEASWRDGSDRAPSAADIRAAVGPCIGPTSYEVGPEFPLRFVAEDPASASLLHHRRRGRDISVRSAGLY